MDYFSINSLREANAGWSLLRAQNASLALTFFMSAFTVPNQRNLGRQDLIDVLEDILFSLRDSLGEDRFPRTAAEYLDDWAEPGKAWLRKFYTDNRDEPVYDLTAATEDVIRWVEALRGRDFVPTQSRLSSIFNLLKTLVHGSETDPEERLAELQRQRDDIDAQMQQIRSGDIPVMSSPEAIDHFHQLTTQAKDLLADFREVETNFRKLDRNLREQISMWEGSQGDLLESIFSSQQDISGSLQGRTFQGFWDYLMSPALRSELHELLDRATRIEALTNQDGLQSITSMQKDWLPAVEQTQATVRQLSAQIRRLLDDKVYLENKRIMALIRSIESSSVAVRTNLPSGTFADLSGHDVPVALPFERPLYEPSRQIAIHDGVGVAEDLDVDANALFTQFHVDPQRLAGNIDAVVTEAGQATLADITDAYPLSQGLAELVTYFQLASESMWATINSDRSQTLSWTLPDGSLREATVDQIIFVRPS
ncbi:DUF3375 domain-containing protein [Arthrobacter sp. E3]|uniref:DUF3375 family protein n=1 Tax=Arthrobacter sp. E3 TaxID=517402 RepID=UPI001A9498E0